MFKIPTKNFPPEGYHAVTIWPFLFYKGELTDNDVKHENIHQRQYLICIGIGLVVLLLKIWLLPNWIILPFIIFPFILFYIAWFIGYKVKGYDNMKMEQNANNAEK
jgi:Flp pilus assembly protein TadB